MTIRNIAYAVLHFSLELLIILRYREMDKGDYKERCGEMGGYIPDKNRFLSFYALTHWMIDDRPYRNTNPAKNILVLYE